MTSALQPFHTLTDEQRALFDNNQRLVPWVVRHKFMGHLTSLYEFDDAVSDGNLGLLRAAQLFEPERGYKFSTYAINWITRYMHEGKAALDGINGRRIIRAGSGDLPRVRHLSDPVTNPSGEAMGGVTYADVVADFTVDDPRDSGWTVDRDKVYRLLTEQERLILSMPYQSAAEVLGIQVESVKQRRRRLQLRLAAQLAAEAA